MVPLSTPRTSGEAARALLVNTTSLTEGSRMEAFMMDWMSVTMGVMTWFGSGTMFVT